MGDANFDVTGHGNAGHDNAGLNSADFDQAVALLAGKTIAVLTGAGVSTDSGIPDYRGEGAPVRNPMTFDQFRSDRNSHQRYWAGSHRGWRRFAAAAPNPGHLALAELESAGIVSGVVTQNVDGLHRRAGSGRVIELHGTMDRVRCLSCGQVFARAAVAAELSKANPWLDTAQEFEARPDGDVEPGYSRELVVPECSNCGGTLKPDVVFFGELVPRDTFRAARSLVENTEALVVAGSSLAVNSGIRLLDRANRAGHPIVIINRGATKGDSRASIRLEAGTSETLAALAQRLQS